MKRYFLAVIGIASLTMASTGSAIAVTYDFVKEGQIHEFGYETWDSSDHNKASDAAHLSAFNTGKTYAYDQPGGLQISASNGLDPNDQGYVGYSAYFDNFSSGNPGGLGVCQTGDANGNGIKGEGAGTSPNGCFANSDDNQMQGEWIHMLFDDGPVNLDSLTITGDHAPIVDGVNLAYSVNGDAEQLLDIGGGPNVLTVFAMGLLNVTTFDYHIVRYDPSEEFMIDGGQIYLAAMTVSPVPVPAAFWLFGTALIGFITLSRRTRV